MKILAGSVDRASAALVRDLRQRGMPDDTLVLWAASSGARRWARAAGGARGIPP